MILLLYLFNSLIEKKVERSLFTKVSYCLLNAQIHTAVYLPTEAHRNTYGPTLKNIKCVNFFIKIYNSLFILSDNRLQCHLLDACTMHIQTDGSKTKARQRNLALTYTITYALIHTIIHTLVHTLTQQWTLTVSTKVSC